MVFSQEVSDFYIRLNAEHNNVLKFAKDVESWLAQVGVLSGMLSHTSRKY